MPETPKLTGAAEIPTASLMGVPATYLYSNLFSKLAGRESRTDRSSSVRVSYAARFAGAPRPTVISSARSASGRYEVCLISMTYDVITKAAATIIKPFGTKFGKKLVLKTNALSDAVKRESVA
jgi:hypothetical protein